MCWVEMLRFGSFFSIFICWLVVNILELPHSSSSLDLDGSKCGCLGSAHSKYHSNYTNMWHHLLVSWLKWEGSLCIVELWKVGTDYSANAPLSWRFKSVDTSTDGGSSLNNPDWGLGQPALEEAHWYLPLGIAKTTRNQFRSHCCYLGVM